MNQQSETPVNDKPIIKWLGKILNEHACKLGEALMGVRLLIGLLIVVITLATAMIIQSFDRLDQLVDGQVHLQKLLLEHTLTDHEKQS